MKNTKIIITLILLLLLADNLSSQDGGRIKRLLDLYGRTAYSYFLSANRPGFGVDAYLTDKGKFFVSTGVSYGDDCIDIPLGISYGISNRMEVSAGISPFTQAYSFAGIKAGGVGDSYLGMKFRIQESEMFAHAFQTVVKIPTAGKQEEIGTGKFDFHFGAAESFYYNKFGYDLGLELNFLQRRDLPTSRKYITYFQNAIDSIESAYDYRFEPELVVSLGPSYQFTERFSVYTGFSFSRNFKLDYNTSGLYGGFGVSLSNTAGFGLGGSYGTGEVKSWSISSNFYFTF